MGNRGWSGAGGGGGAASYLNVPGIGNIIVAGGGGGGGGGSWRVGSPNTAPASPDVQVLLIQNLLPYLEVAVKQDFKATPMAVAVAVAVVDLVVDLVVIKV